MMKKILVIVIFLIVCSVAYTIIGIVQNVELSKQTYGQPYHFPIYPVPDTKGKSAELVAQIKKGEYLVKMGDCIACHSAKDTPAFAGAYPMQTPFGVLYSPNITPDKETGIGTWSDDQFIKAMHNGIAPDGSYYYPAFPYLYFNQISYDDLKAIKAYLNSIPAVHLKNRDNGMVWPFNWRIMQLGWRILFFRATGPFKPNPAESEKWNRGAYIVDGLGHCAMCHTPSYYVFSKEISMAAPDRKYDLTGATVEGYLAPNITQTNLGAIPDNELIKVFTDYRLLGGTELKGPMLEAVHDSLIHLTTPDLYAIITYMKSVKSKLPPQPAVSESSVGQYVYNSYCSGCHAMGVGGAPRFGNIGDWRPLAKSGIDNLYIVAIQGGGNMPAKGTCISCTNQEVRAAVDYMVAAALGGKRPMTQTVSIAPHGEQIYENYCSSCHTSGNNNAPKLGDKTAWKPIADKGFLQAYYTVVNGRNGHPVKGKCTLCNDQDIIATIKYMMHKGVPDNNYDLW
jgi:cytochrome c5